MLLDEAESYTALAALPIMASSSSFTYCCPPSSSPVWPEPLYSLRPEHARERLQDDSVETVTSIEQVRWQGWARRPRGAFWEQESRLEVHLGGKRSLELQLPYCTAPPPPSSRRPDWGFRAVCLWGCVGYGRVVVRVGLGGQGSAPVLCFRWCKESCSMSGSHNSLSGPGSPLHSA